MGIIKLGSFSQADQLRAGKWQVDVKKKWKNPCWEQQNSYWGIVPSSKFNLSIDGGSESKIWSGKYWIKGGRTCLGNGKCQGTMKPTADATESLLWILGSVLGQPG